MARFRPGVRVKYSDGRIYRVMFDGSYRRKDGGKMSKAERKKHKKEQAKVHGVKTRATGRENHGQ